MAAEKSPNQRVALKALILNPLNQVLLGREAPGGDNTKVGRWGAPGGRVEPGEGFGALERELAEEVPGMPVKVGNVNRPIYFDLWKQKIDNVPHEIFGAFVVCRTAELVAPWLGSEGDENDLLRFIELDERHTYNIKKEDGFALAALAECIGADRLDIHLGAAISG